MASKLAAFESKLQQLIEENVLRLFPFVSNAHDLVNILIKTMIEITVEDSDGNTIAPSKYVLLCHPDHLPREFSKEQIQNGLLYALVQAANVSEIYFANLPEVIIQTSIDIPIGDVIINPGEVKSENDVTQIMDIPGYNKKETAKIPKAFLIVNGNIHYIMSPIFNIGRDLSNDLEISDSKISRKHAQIRRIDNRYKIFDLGSTGGSFVNGQPIKQRFLAPGDVISLAGFPIIFGLDTSDDDTPTRPLIREKFDR